MGNIDNLQQQVEPWLLECFGETIAQDIEERNYRFLEESLELVQSLGASAEDCHKLVDYTFGRDIGDPKQELGGVMITLAALAIANNLSMENCAFTELDRIWLNIDKIREKQRNKPLASPLPE